MNYFAAPGIAISFRAASVDKIIRCVCDCLGLTFKQINARNRRRDLVEARHLVMYFVRAKTKLTLKETGAIFNCDHSTVINAVNLIRNLIPINEQISYKFNLIEANL